jgi:HTH-type transcriptional regulator / antitoxin HigA
MDIHPIRTEADYEVALRAVSALVDLDPAPGAPQGDELEILAILVKRYEAGHFPMALPNPIDAIKFRMEQAGLTVADMQP